MECGLLNPGPPAHPPVCPSARPTDCQSIRPSSPPVRPTTGLPVRLSAQSARLRLFHPRPPSPPVCLTACPPVCLSTRPPDRLSARPHVLGPVRASSARSHVRASYAPSTRLLDCPSLFRPRPPDRPRLFLLVHPTASSAPVCPSARPLCARISCHVHLPRLLRARIVRHVRLPRPPRPLRPRETAAAIYTPPRLPSDHPPPRSPCWIPSLCCVFKDCGTTRGSRTSGGWSELRGKPLQFFLSTKLHGKGDHLHPGRLGYSSS